MKTLKIAFAMMALAMFSFFSVDAEAQRRTTVGTLLTGLLNVNISDVEVDVQTGDINIITVENVLNNADINFLNNSINNNSILSDITVTLTDVLQNFLNDNQVVVGVLSNGTFVVQTVEGL
jgi:hypothetical protein